MNDRQRRLMALADVVALPIFVLAFIWRLQFLWPNSWMVFPVWITASFLLHRDTPKTLGWRADNLPTAFRQAGIATLALGALLLVIAVALGSWRQPIAHLFLPDRMAAYFAFCVLQQVALCSLLANRLLFLFRGRAIAAAVAAGAIFGAIHWPNPVLVPCTLVGGTVMAWLFARERNIIPLAVMQALLSALVWWSFPVAWHHRMRVGPGYETYRSAERRTPHCGVGGPLACACLPAGMSCRTGADRAA